jgi:hypothetical protein
MAGGPWSPATVGQGRPGLFINFVPTAIAAIQPGARGIVATIGRAAWGPDSTPQVISNRGDQLNYYWNNETSPNNLPYAIRNMFDGGARQVIAYRIEGAGAAKATRIVNDTQGTPAPAFTLTGKYNGVRANNFFVVVQANAADSTKTDVSLYEGTSLLATWTSRSVARGVAGHIKDIVDTINADTNNFWVTAAVTGTDSSATTSTPASVAAPGSQFAGGADGAAPTLGDYNNALSSLEGQYWNVFTADILNADLTGIEAAIKSKIQDMRNYGRYVTYVTGSALAETATTAATNVAGINCECGHYVWPGVKQVNPITGALQTYRGAAIAAQVAGMRSSLLAGKGLTYAVLQNVVDLEQRGTQSAMTNLANSGVMAFFYDGTFFRIDKGNTTLVNVTTAYAGKTLPAGFKKASVVNTVDQIAEAVTSSANLNYIGQIENDEDGQRALLGAIRDFLTFMQGQKALKRGWTVTLDPNNASVGDRVFLAWNLTPVDTTDYIYNTITIGQ